MAYYSYKCHNTQALNESPNCESEALAFRQEYLNKDELELDRLYKGYDACADFIAAAFYQELLEKYLDSKVILTERSTASWCRSITNTIFMTAPYLMRDDRSYLRYEFGQLVGTLVFDGLLKHTEKYEDAELFKKMYLNHNAEVKRLAPADT